MPAATPKPSLEDLLTILSRCSGLRANFPDLSGGLSVAKDTVEICFKFKREHLGPSAKWVFEQPSTILPTLIELLQYDDMLEKQFRAQGVNKTLDDCKAFIEQMAKSVDPSMGALYAKQARDHLSCTAAYLRELDRRRREAERRVKEAEEINRKAEEEELRRKVEEALRKEKAEKQRAKEEARARWEREEAEKRQRDSKRTSDSGTNSNQKGPPPGGGNFWDDHFFEEMLRASGVDPNTFKQKFGGDPFSKNYHSNFYGGKSSFHSETPSGGKRKWFEVLGCAPGASRDEIRRAARERAKGMHPDIPGQDTPENQARIREINEAKAEGLQGCT